MSSARPGALVVITGSTASGKSTVARALSQDIGWPYIEFGELARARFRDYLAVHPDAGDLQTFVQDVLWSESGKDALALDLIRIVPKSRRLIAVGPRSPAEIETLYSARGGQVVLVHLIAPASVRFARDLKRPWKYAADLEIGEYAGFSSRNAIEHIWGVEEAGRMSQVLLVQNASVSSAVGRIIRHLYRLGVLNNDDCKAILSRRKHLRLPNSPRATELPWQIE